MPRTDGKSVHTGEGCRLESLSEAGNTRIDRCSHGWIHVTVGGVSLRLHPHQCQQLTAALQHAVVHLDQEPFATDRVLC